MPDDCVIFDARCPGFATDRDAPLHLSVSIDLRPGETAVQFRARIIAGRGTSRLCRRRLPG